MKLRAYALSYGSDCLIGESDTPGPNGERVVGAYFPGHDGNYYKEIFIGYIGDPSPYQYTMGFQKWWEWLKTSIKEKQTLMDDDFPFDPEHVEVIEFEIPIEPHQLLRKK